MIQLWTLLLGIFVFAGCGDSQELSSEDVKIPYYKKQYDMCNQGSEFDLNDQCRIISYEHINVCLAKAKQICQHIALCADKALTDILTDTDILVNRLQQIHTKSTLESLLSGALRTYIKLEYDKTRKGCSRGKTAEFRSFLKTFEVKEESNK